MRGKHVSILLALCLIGCDGDSPAAPTTVLLDPVDVPAGPSVPRPAFKVMTYNVQLANFGAPNPESRDASRSR